ncbi:MAG: outer membrane beta-barrel protein [Thermoguttaceae bacterium]|nr:outer membrane beta-barrel protein [Thermoguttaceae bacterium]
MQHIIGIAGAIMNKLNLFIGIALSLSVLLVSQTFAASGCNSAACEPASIPEKDSVSGSISDYFGSSGALNLDNVPAEESAPEGDNVPEGDSVSGSISDYFGASGALDLDSVPARENAPEGDSVSGSISDYFGASAALDLDSVPARENAPEDESVPGSISDYFSASGALDLGNAPIGNSASGFLSDITNENGFYDAFSPNDRAGRYNNSRKSLLNDYRFSGYLNTGCNTNFVNDLSNGMVDRWSNSAPSFNAIYISIIKKATTDGYGADLGFGVDYMFGEDARIFRSDRGLDEEWITGNMYNPNNGRYNIPSYGFAMPQLYMEAAINNWTIKAGHFYGLLGYESATAPRRFFYTRGLTCVAAPVSQSGLLATFNGFQNLDITLGWVNGWNNGFDNSRFCDGLCTGSFTYRISPEAYIKYAFLAGTADMAGVFKYWGPFNWGHTKGVGTAHSVVFDLLLTSRIETVTTMYYTDFGQASYSSNGTRALILGEYLYYTINHVWKAGFRAEWMKNTDYIGGSAQDTEVSSFAMGLNCHPFGNQNLYLRPEIRFEKARGVWYKQILNERDSQVTVGFDVMMTF